MKIKLTQDTLRRLTPGTDYRDTTLPGLVVRVHRSGRASYLVSLGRGKWFTIGPVERFTVAQARDEARGLLGDVSRGADPVAAKRAKRSSQTFRRFLRDTYAPWLRQHRKTAEEIVTRLELHFVPSFGSTQLSNVTGFAVERWRSARLKAGTSPVTVNRDISDLRGCLSRAVEWGVLAEHPLRSVKSLKADTSSHVRYLSADEETRLRTALAARDNRRRADRDRANIWRRDREYPEWPTMGVYTDNLTALVLLALNTGERFGELANLQWPDVDLARAILTLHGTVGTGTKGGKTRHLPLNAEALTVLRAWQSSSSTDGYVFPGKDGERLMTIKTAWGRLMRDAKIEDFRLHDCRHDFASKLVMNGVDLNTVRELLGHSDLKMVLRYAHLAPEHLASAVEKLGR